MVAATRTEVEDPDALLAEFVDSGIGRQPTAEELDTARRELRVQAQAAAEREAARAEATEARRLAENEECRRRRERCTCAEFPPYGRPHDDDCLTLSEEERQRRAEAKRRALERRVDAVRRNGLLLLATSEVSDLEQKVQTAKRLKALTS